MKKNSSLFFSVLMWQQKLGILLPSAIRLPFFCFTLLLLAVAQSISCNLLAQEPVDYVNPFIGTTHYGTCHPGAVCPQGMMSVAPFNVMGSELNRYDKDHRWWSTPYDHTNAYFTGYSHVNLSGVGCPDLGSLLLMPTSGDTLCVDFHQYGSLYEAETATPGYYANRLIKYGIATEVTATPRTSMARFTFPKGRAHILLNLGEGLTNESGATLRWTGPNEVEGSKLLGCFCYDARQAVFPIYFVMRVEHLGGASGYWKFQRPKKGIEAEWDPDDNRYKIYTHYRKEISGDDVGAWYTFDATQNEQVEVRIGVSFVSIEGARRNLEAEQGSFHFDEIRALAHRRWQADLNRIQVEGGTPSQRTVFYTALYHLLLQPNLLQDVDGRYPAMESNEIRTTSGNRYTVFSLWDTYRTVHPFLTLVYPERQLDMVRSLLAMYNEQGRLPRWELYGRETLTMEGDPAVPMIADTWLRGLRHFDAELAYAAMRKAVMERGDTSLLRPDNDDYSRLGYVPLREQYDNSVSHALEYATADYALSRMAVALGKAEDARYFSARSLGYRRYYNRESGTLRPLLPDGTFLSPFNPCQGENFAPCPGFHEGSAWNYTFSQAYDVKGLARLMGGPKAYVKKLQHVFDASLFDPTNEPDMVYPYLFSLFKGEAWRTQQLTRRLLHKHFTDRPDGLPGNDDTGTMSAWALFSMLGFYPYCPGNPEYILTAPVFERVVIRLQSPYNPSQKLIIEAPGAADTTALVRRVTIGGRPLSSYVISHDQLTSGGVLHFEMSR